MRIAVGGIHIESSTFTPYTSSVDDFRILRGTELLKSYPWTGIAVEAAKSEEQKEECTYPKLDFIQWEPLIHARALPGGQVDANFYDSWSQEFFRLLDSAIEKGPLDGVLLDIHGAMVVEGMTDLEGTLAEKIRNHLGYGPMISATMDLHGNVSEKLFRNCDLLTCYRTAPHVDALETRYRATTNLIRSITEPQKPLFRTRIAVPILLPGEKTSTEIEPARSLYLDAQNVTKDPNIIDASIWMGFPWADEPRCHGAVVVIGTEQRSVEQTAEYLANRYWDSRHSFQFVGPTAEVNAAVRMALSATEGPFFVSDTGDNTGAGGAGDSVVLLREFLKQSENQSISKSILFAAIHDPASAAIAREHTPGQNLRLRIGSSPQPEQGEAIELDVTLKHIFTDSTMGGDCAVVSTKHIDIILTENRTQYGTLQKFSTAGYSNLKNVDIIIVKMGYLEPDLSESATGWVMALTPGGVDQNLTRLQYEHLSRPLFPFDDELSEMNWSPLTIQRKNADV